MKLPDKFYFFHTNDKSVTYFAARDGHNYVISGGALVGHTRTTDDVELFLRHGHWVLTVPDKSCVRGLFTYTAYSVSKDENGLYVLKDQETGDVFFHRHEDVLKCVYGVSPLWEILENTTENTTEKQFFTHNFFVSRDTNLTRLNDLFLSSRATI